MNPATFLVPWRPLSWTPETVVGERQNLGPGDILGTSWALALPGLCCRYGGGATRVWGLLPLWGRATQVLGTSGPSGPPRASITLELELAEGEV